MGEVGIVYKLMPSDIDVDLDKVSERIKASLPKVARLNLIKQRPIAFGLKALEVQVILDDKKGGAETIEEYLGTLEGISSVEVVTQTLL